MISFLKSFFKYSKILTTKKRVYLDHAGATPISPSVLHTLATMQASLYGNASAIYKEGVEAKKVLQGSRKTIASILNARPYELYFSGSGTESVALALEGVVAYWYSTHVTKGSPIEKLPHVITTVIEHPAVLETLRFLEREGKIEVSYIPVTQDGVVEVKKIREALQEETILVTIMYANNEIGTIQPVKEIGKMLKDYREKNKREKDIHEQAYPYFHIDACQAGNYLPLDTTSLRVDLMTINSSKIYGPKGVALLFKREGVMVMPQVYGGGQERGLRSGTEAVPLIAAFAQALKEAQEMRVHTHTEGPHTHSHAGCGEVERLQALQTQCVEDLKKAIPRIVFYGSFEKGMRLPNTINCRIPGILSEEMIIRLDALGFSVSHKSACASEQESGSHVIVALGASDEEASENIRISMGRDTTANDMKRFVESVASLARKYAKPVQEK